MAITTTTALTIAAVTALAGTAISAVGTIQQGKAAQKAANFQAEVQRQQAERERLIAASNEQDFRRQQARLMASRRAILGGSGISGGTGSPLLASEDFAGEVELQALRIRNQGEVGATRLQQQASLNVFEGRAARSAGFVRAGSSLLQGVSNAASIKGGFLTAFGG